MHITTLYSSVKKKKKHEAYTNVMLNISIAEEAAAHAIISTTISGDKNTKGEYVDDFLHDTSDKFEISLPLFPAILLRRRIQHKLRNTKEYDREECAYE